DREIFTPDAHFLEDELVDRARQTAFLVPGLRLSIRDERGSEPSEQVFQYDGGISEFVDHLSPDQAVTDTWRVQGNGKFTERIPVDGRMQDIERDCEVDIALRWGTGYDTAVKSFVNIIATPKGGTHMSGFEQALLRVFRKVVEANARRLKAGKDKLDKDDVLAGLTAVVTVRIAEPQFEGQTKEVLGTPAARQIVSRIVSEQLES